jgi:hypothetical protein
MAQSKGFFVITANLTEDGSVAYLRPDRSWTPRLSEAGVIESPEVVQEMLQLAAQQERIVCDAYAMKVRPAEDGPLPLSARELIRSEGPTTRIRRPDPVTA